MRSALKLELLVFFLPHIEGNCHIYMLVGIARADPAIITGKALDRPRRTHRALETTSQNLSPRINSN